MTEDIRPGDRVEWQSHGSKAAGKVRRRITTDTRAAGRQVRASEDDPQFLVQSEKSGGEAVHKPDSLKKNPPPDRSAEGQAG